MFFKGILVPDFSDSQLKRIVKHQILESYSLSPVPLRRLWFTRLRPSVSATSWTN